MSRWRGAPSCLQNKDVTSHLRDFQCPNIAVTNDFFPYFNVVPLPTYTQLYPSTTIAYILVGSA